MSESHVSYSCGYCAYPLNLKSSDQIASAESSEQKKSTGKNFVSFRAIDQSRFTQEEEISCFPIYFGREHPKTQLFCRKCGAHVGHVCTNSTFLSCFQSSNSSRSSSHRFYVDVQALQPYTDS
ncbi:hypothetical protein SAY87_026498 [Trapa incisa]|uniref:Uncharacterized protein n=1 Tax=Trapa incisa TaxID=236973 RepID=A0AAN7JL38_9MYRT|nr:hypothetical protein SAY87_026498 [Trapa incisa]